MIISDYYNEKSTFNIFKKLIKINYDYKSLNEIIIRKYNIFDFFESDDDLDLIRTELSNTNSQTLFENKIEYGDFQTPLSLADEVCKYLINIKINPDVLIEPTCGIGNFVISALRNFDKIKEIFCIEINKYFALITKIRLMIFLEYNKPKYYPKIKVINSNIFDFNFDDLEIVKDSRVLILGNPPWVTNTKLSLINSDNLPQKSNFKLHSGMDAITGKSNFDISEFITLSLIKYFENFNANLCFLIKNSVVKNLIYDQKKNNYKISNLKKITFDARKEFDVAVDACLFYCDLNKEPELDITESNLTGINYSKRIGWIENNFVADLEKYKLLRVIDGKSQFIWRSGIKHDLSKVMELQKFNGKYKNKLGEDYYLEDNLIYSYLKGSYLKEKVIDKSILFTIVTQKNVSEDTAYIANDLPNTYKYLTDHESFFNKRKSSIYKDKPEYSIFGIGDYSFKPYKLAIAALYKKFSVSLILPDVYAKPVMLDDTCYFLGFDNLDYALITYCLLNNDIVREFIDTISFNDSKRKFTKDILMRIDLFNVSQSFSLKKIKQMLDDEFISRDFKISEISWINYINEININKKQLVFY